MQEHVGHKVEVTGMLIPGGNTRTETTTRTDREDAPDTKTRDAHRDQERDAASSA